MCSPAPSSSPLLMKRRASLPSSPNNYFLYPILQEGVTMLSTLSTSMSNLPTSILNILGLSQTDSTTSTQNMTSMMRELVMDQQRTMFYTVTMCPTQKEAPETKRILTPSLKVIGHNIKLEKCSKTNTCKKQSIMSDSTIAQLIQSPI